MVRAPNPRGNRCFSCIGMIRRHKKGCCKCTTCDCSIWIGRNCYIYIYIEWMCVFVLSVCSPRSLGPSPKNHAVGPTTPCLRPTEADVRCGHWWYLRNVGGGELPTQRTPPQRYRRDRRDRFLLWPNFQGFMKSGGWPLNFRFRTNHSFRSWGKRWFLLVKYMVQIVQKGLLFCCSRTSSLFCQWKQETCLLNVIDFVSVYVWMIEVQLWVKTIITILIVQL